MISLSPRLRQLLQPLNLAAVLTWTAVLAAQSDEAAVVGSARYGVLIGLMLAFLLVFLWPDLYRDEDRQRAARRRSAWLQAGLALAVCGLSRSTTAPVLLVVVLAQLAMVLPLVALSYAAVALNLALLGIFSLVWQASRPFLLLAIYGGFQAFAALTAWYARQAEANAMALREVNANLLATRSLLEESARDQERLRLARELHDVAGHKLTALKLNLALLQRGVAEDPPRSLALSVELAGELLDDLRGVVAQMRQHDGMDLRRAIEQLVAPLPRPRIRLELADDARVDNVAQAEALIRAVQEALTNVVRHAQAQQALVSLRREGAAIVLEVSDDGRGWLRPCEGHGLAGMRERVESLGGTVRVDSPPAGGFRVCVSLPV